MAATYKFVVGGVTTDLIADYGMKVQQILGAGMPPVSPIISKYALTNGASYQRRIIEPRIISIVCVAQGATLTALHAIRKTIINDIGSGDSFTFKYSPNAGVVGELSLDVRYVGGLELGEQEAFSEKIVIRLLATDPLWYAADAAPVSLTYVNLDKVCAVLTRSTKLYWLNTNAAGQPTAVPRNGLAVSADGTVLWAASGSSLYKFASSAWTSYTANGAVNAVKYDAAGNLYVGGAFTTINGVAASKIAVVSPSFTFTALGTPNVGTVNAIDVDKFGRPWLGGDAGVKIQYYGSGTWNNAGTPAATIYTLSAISTGNSVLAGGTSGYVGLWPGGGVPPGAPSAGNVYAILLDPDGVRWWVGGDYTLGGVQTFLAYYNGNTGAWTVVTGLSGAVHALLFQKSGTLYIGSNAGGQVFKLLPGTLAALPAPGILTVPNMRALAGDSTDATLAIGLDATTQSNTWGKTQLTNTTSAVCGFKVTILPTVAATLLGLVNLTTGAWAAFSRPIAVGETVTIDTSTGKIVSSGSGAIYGAVTDGGPLNGITLQPGVNQIGLLISPGTATANGIVPAKFLTVDGLST